MYKDVAVCYTFCKNCGIGTWNWVYRSQDPPTVGVAPEPQDHPL